MDGSVERRGFANSVGVNTTEKAYQVGRGVGYLIRLARRGLGGRGCMPPSLQGAEFRNLEIPELVPRRWPCKVAIFLEGRYPRARREYPMRAGDRKWD